MSKSLVIVESPNKVKTISKFLGKNYTVKSSVGHIRDLSKLNTAKKSTKKKKMKTILPRELLSFLLMYSMKPKKQLHLQQY